MLEARRNLPVPLDFEQPSLFIEHSLEGDVVPQRPRDGYINATLLCNKAGKRFHDYRRLATTEEFLKELSLETGIPASNLIEVFRGRGDRVSQGTWVHPQLAIHLAQWLSSAFAVQVTKWVVEWAQGNVQSFMPVHVRRYMKNRAKIPHTHFSMLNEIVLNLFAQLEEYGVIPPDRLMPDISTGRMFSDFLRGRGINPREFPTYEHEFTDGRPTVNARLYPIEYLPAFRLYFNEVWLPEKAETYLATNFPKALPFLPRILPLPHG